MFQGDTTKENFPVRTWTVWEDIKRAAGVVGGMKGAGSGWLLLLLGHDASRPVRCT